MMKNIIPILLKSYDQNNPELFLKAKFLLAIIVTALLGLTVTLAYTSYTFGINSTTVTVELVGFAIMLSALIFLIKGHYFQAGHIILVAGFSIVWIIMFTEPLTSELIKLDTIVFILVLLACIPLMFFKNKNPLLLYFFMNIGIFGIFNYYLFQEGNLTHREHVDYALDNTVAMLIILVIALNLFKIYHQALSSIKNELLEKERAESSLREFRIFLTSIINSMPSMIIGVDHGQKVVLWNKEAKKITGIRSSVASGNKLFEVFPQLRLLESQLKSVIQDKKINQWHKQPFPWMDEDCFMDITIYPFSYGSDQGAVIRLDDITEQLKMEKIFVQSEKMALVGQVAGKIAHDFNNVLGIIMGHSELSLFDCKDQQVKKTLELIYAQTIRGKNLTKNLVGFAKDQEPKQKFFRINEKIDLVTNLLKKDLKEIKLIKEYKSGLPDIFADPGMIEHALVNILQNSIHATSKTENATICIRTYYHDDMMFIEIEDNGCGIPKAKLKNVFDPFFTLKGNKDVTGSYKKSIKGTGYGMANVKKYIDQHNGSILIDTDFDSGIKITISLPIVQKELPDKENKGIRQSTLFLNKYILLVEDEQAISEVQHKILTQEPYNHRVDIAHDGEVAMDLIQRNKYDFINLDYALSGKANGMDVYSCIRKINQTIPILFVSGNIEFLQSIKGLKQIDSFVDHLSKPWSQTDYLKSINELIQRSLAMENRDSSTIG